MTWRLMHSVRAPGPLKTRKLGALGVRTLSIPTPEREGRAAALHVQEVPLLKSVAPFAVSVVSNARPLTNSRNTPEPTVRSPLIPTRNTDAIGGRPDRGLQRTEARELFE